MRPRAARGHRDQRRAAARPPAGDRRGGAGDASAARRRRRASPRGSRRARCRPCCRPSPPGTPARRPSSPTPIHSRWVTSWPNTLFASTVSNTRPPAMTVWTSEIGASESAADVQAPRRHRHRHAERVGARAEQPQRRAERPPPLDVGRLDRAAVLQQEAEQRRDRRRERQHQAELDGEGHGKS